MIQSNALSSGEVLPPQIPGCDADAPLRGELLAASDEPVCAEPLASSQPAASAADAEPAESGSVAGDEQPASSDAAAASPIELPAAEGSPPAQGSSEPPAALAGELYDPEVPPDLHCRQRLALVSLARGANVTKACEQAGISRTTLYRWINEDGAFRAAYTRWQSLTRLSAHGQVLALQDLAAEVLREQLEFKRDARLAAHILEKTGALAPPAPGPTHPGRAAAHLAAEQREQDIAAAKRAEQVERDGRYLPTEFRFTDSTKPPKT